MLSYKSGYLCKNIKVLDLYKKVEASIKYVEHNKKEIELAELKQEEVFAQMQKDYEAFWEARKKVVGAKIITGDLAIAIPVRDTVFMENQDPYNLWGSLSMSIGALCIPTINDPNKRKKIINQVFLGEYSKEEDRTLEGTALEIAVGFTPIGIIQDVRDLTYYFTNWEWSWKHVGLTGLAIVALIPGVSEVKKIIKGVNQGSDLVKNASKISRALDSGSLSKLKSLSIDALEDIKKVGSEISDDIGDGLNKIFKNNKGLEAAGIGPIDYLDDIGKIKKVDTSDIPPLNDIQNNYNKIVNGGEGIKGGGKAEASTKISTEMKNKILEGRRKSPTKNEVIGGHSSNINNNNDIFAVEEISINPDGTKNIKFTKDFQDGNISKIKKSTIFPDSWSDSKILDSIKEVGESPTISVRQRDGATFHRQIIDGVEIDVIKIGDDVVSGYPTGKVNAPKPSGF